VLIDLPVPAGKLRPIPNFPPPLPGNSFVLQFFDQPRPTSNPLSLPKTSPRLLRGVPVVRVIGVVMLLSVFGSGEESLGLLTPRVFFLFSTPKLDVTGVLGLFGLKAPLPRAGRFSSI